MIDQGRAGIAKSCCVLGREKLNPFTLGFTRDPKTWSRRENPSTLWDHGAALGCGAVLEWHSRDTGDSGRAPGTLGTVAGHCGVVPDGPDPAGTRRKRGAPRPRRRGNGARSGCRPRRRRSSKPCPRRRRPRSDHGLAPAPAPGASHPQASNKTSWTPPDESVSAAGREWLEIPVWGPSPQGEGQGPPPNPPQRLKGELRVWGR